MSFRSATLLAISMPATLLVAAAVAPEHMPKPMMEWLSSVAQYGKADRTGVVGYDVQPVTRGSVRKKVQSSGTVRPLVTVQISSQLSGQIKSLKADFNSEVGAGDVLAVLDNKIFVARVEQAAADLEMAKAMLANQVANREKAEAVLRQAERAKGRQKELGQKGLSALAQVDTAVRDAEVAAAELSVAEALIVSARANIVQRKAVLAQAQIDLERTEVRAPIGGIVISRTVDVGQTVAASLQAPELFRIAQNLRHIRIEALVSEADIGGVAEGNPVAFRVDAHPGRQFEGRVSQVRFASIEEQSVVSYTVVVEASNEDMALYPGMTAHVEIETSRRDNVVRVPVEALRFRPRGMAGQAAAVADNEPTDKTARREHQLERLAKHLGLSEAQINDARARYAKLAVAAKARDGKTAHPEPGGQKQQGTASATSTDLMVIVLEPMLDGKGRQALADWKAGRAHSRTGTVWLLASDGGLTRKSVRIGLVDGRQAEIIGGVHEADMVAVRANKAGSSPKSASKE